jgi:hypothetical protein
MDVQFRRTAARGYAVMIIRKDLPVVEMNPAPGYDPLVPHDLMHLIVELELGLSNGIFGQVAKGGNAGSFRLIGEDRKDGRQVKRHRKRGEKLRRGGRDDCAQSERATWVCWQEWLSRSQRKKLTTDISAHAQSVRGNVPALTDAVINRICMRLDDLSARWASLGVGESITVEWPDKFQRGRRR